MCPIKNKSLTKIVIWLATEILFNFVGIDDLADYSEFVFEKHFDRKIWDASPVLVARL